MLSKSLAVVLLATTLATPTQRAKTGPQTVTDAVAAMTQVANFHVEGYYISRGVRTEENLSVSPSGGGGTVKTDGAVIQVVSYRHSLYLKGDEHSFYVLTSGDAGFAKKFAGKWVQFPKTAPDASNWFIATKSSLLTHTVVPGRLVGGFVRYAKAKWGGRSAVVLRGSGLELYVADTGTPYLLHEQEDGFYYSFTDFGDAPMPRVPKSFYRV